MPARWSKPAAAERWRELSFMRQFGRHVQAMAILRQLAGGTPRSLFLLYDNIPHGAKLAPQRYPSSTWSSCGRRRRLTLTTACPNVTTSKSAALGFPLFLLHHAAVLLGEGAASRRAAQQSSVECATLDAYTCNNKWTNRISTVIGDRGSSSNAEERRAS